MQIPTDSEMTQAEINLSDEKFDYTEWRKKYFADMDLETFINEAVEYNKAHPFQGSKNND